MAILSRLISSFAVVNLHFTPFKTDHKKTQSTKKKTKGWFISACKDFFIIMIIYHLWLTSAPTRFNASKWQLWYITFTINMPWRKMVRINYCIFTESFNRKLCCAIGFPSLTHFPPFNKLNPISANSHCQQIWAKSRLFLGKVISRH